VLKTNKKLRL